MNKYVQLKDGVVFATLSTAGEIEESISIVKVDVDPETLLNKKYENNVFVDAQLIKYAVLDPNNNTVIAIYRTMFSSEVSGPIILTDNVDILWTWDGQSFNPPPVPQLETIEEITSDPIINTPVEQPVEPSGSEEPLSE